MLFDQKEFEYNINENKLQKGLKLFLADKVEPLSHAAGDFKFIIHEKNPGEITVRIKAGKVLTYNCFCADKNYCEHLAAALFYLQKENLQLLKIGQKAEKNPVANRKNNTLEKYAKSVRRIVDDYSALPKLKEEHIVQIGNKINVVRADAGFFDHLFYFHLAIVLELSKLSNFKFTSNEKILIDLLEDSICEIKNTKSITLDGKEKVALIAAAHYSLRSQVNFNTGIFSILIPKALVHVKEKSDFILLKSQLKKRKLNKNRLDMIDRKLISEIQLSVMEAKFINKMYPLKKYEDTVELPIALAELDFSMGKNENGFKVLNEYGQKLKTKNNNRYLDFLDEVFLFTKEKNNKIYQEIFLLEKFIYGYIINETELEHYYSLIPLNEKENKTHLLLEKIKQQSFFYSFEKNAVILFYKNWLDELIAEIKTEKNKFRWLHKIAFKKFPNIDEKFVNLYCTHLSQAITDAKFPYFQEQLFNTAKLFLDMLPKDLLDVAMANLRKKLVYDKHMLQFIEKSQQA